MRYKNVWSIQDINEGARLTLPAFYVLLEKIVLKGILIKHAFTQRPILLNCKHALIDIEQDSPAEYIVDCRGASQLGGSLQGIPPRV